MNPSIRCTSHRAHVGILLLSAMVATGCASVRRVPLEDTSAQRLKTVRPVAALSQQELKVSIVPSTGGASFGLIGALVDSAVNNSSAKTAEQKVVPVRNALIGWEAGDALREALEREVAPVAILKASKIEVRQIPSTKGAMAALLQETQQDALFLVEADYRLSPAFDRMVVTVTASLIPAKLAPAAPATPEKTDEADASGPKKLYGNTFVSSRALPGFVQGKTTADEAAALWAADGGRPARRALEDGIDEAARMMAFDVVKVHAAGTPAETFGASDEVPRLESIGPYGLGKLKGWVARQEPGRAWLRIPTGELAAVETP